MAFGGGSRGRESSDSLITQVEDVMRHIKTLKEKRRQLRSSGIFRSDGKMMDLSREIEELYRSIEPTLKHLWHDKRCREPRVCRLMVETAFELGKHADWEQICDDFIQSSDRERKRIWMEDKAHYSWKAYPQNRMQAFKAYEAYFSEKYTFDTLSPMSKEQVEKLQKQFGRVLSPKPGPKPAVKPVVPPVPALPKPPSPMRFEQARAPAPKRPISLRPAATYDYDSQEEEGEVRPQKRSKPAETVPVAASAPAPAPAAAPVPPAVSVITAVKSIPVPAAVPVGVARPVRPLVPPSIVGRIPAPAPAPSAPEVIRIAIHPVPPDDRLLPVKRPLDASAEAGGEVRASKQPRVIGAPPSAAVSAPVSVTQIAASGLAAAPAPAPTPAAVVIAALPVAPVAAAIVQPNKLKDRAITWGMLLAELEAKPAAEKTAKAYDAIWKKVTSGGQKFDKRKESPSLSDEEKLEESKYRFIKAYVCWKKDNKKVLERLKKMLAVVNMPLNFDTLISEFKLSATSAELRELYSKRPTATASSVAPPRPPILVIGAGAASMPAAKKARVIVSSSDSDSDANEDEDQLDTDLEGPGACAQPNNPKTFLGELLELKHRIATDSIKSQDLSSHYAQMLNVDAKTYYKKNKDRFGAALPGSEDSREKSEFMFLKAYLCWMINNKQALGEKQKMFRNSLAEVMEPFDVKALADKVNHSDVLADFQALYQQTPAAKHVVPSPERAALAEEKPPVAVSAPEGVAPAAPAAVVAPPAPEERSMEEDFAIDKAALASQRTIHQMREEGGEAVECRVAPATPDGDCGFTATALALRCKRNPLANSINRTQFIEQVRANFGKGNAALDALVRDIFKTDRARDLEDWCGKFSEKGNYAAPEHFKVLSLLHGLKFQFYCIQESVFKPVGGGYPLIDESGKADATLIRLTYVATHEIDPRRNNGFNHFDALIVAPTREVSTYIDTLMAQVEAEDPLSVILQDPAVVPSVVSGLRINVALANAGGGAGQASAVTRASVGKKNSFGTVRSPDVLAKRIAAAEKEIALNEEFLNSAEDTEEKKEIKKTIAAAMKAKRELEAELADTEKTTQGTLSRGESAPELDSGDEMVPDPKVAAASAPVSKPSAAAAPPVAPPLVLTAFSAAAQSSAARRASPMALEEDKLDTFAQQLVDSDLTIGNIPEKLESAIGLYNEAYARAKKIKCDESEDADALTPVDQFFVHLATIRRVATEVYKSAFYEKKDKKTVVNAIVIAEAGVDRKSGNQIKTKFALAYLKLVREEARLYMQHIDAHPDREDLYEKVDEQQREVLKIYTEVYAPMYSGAVPAKVSQEHHKFCREISDFQSKITKKSSKGAGAYGSKGGGSAAPKNALTLMEQLKKGAVSAGASVTEDGSTLPGSQRGSGYESNNSNAS